VTQPRIATFARLANGNVEPKRVIEGQATKLARTLHGIDYNPVRDETVATNPLAAAVLVFRGGANGEEPPVRVIQGPKTKLIDPTAAHVDVKNKEYIISDSDGSQILVFPEDANGDVAPIRVIKGANTRLGYVCPVAVDPVNDLLVVSNRTYADQTKGLSIFNRTDNGDVAPRAVIAGPKTGIVFPFQIQVHDGKIFVALLNVQMSPMYSLVSIREGIKPDVELKSPWRSDVLGAIAVWYVTDNGDVPPRAIIKGAISGIVHPGGIAINPKDGEIYAVDSVKNGLFSYLVPQFFKLGETNRAQK
jgi:hypothetical protein